MDQLNLLGLAAGTLTTLSFLPQVIKAYRSKETKDLSLVMFLLFSAGLILWIIYGVLNGSWPVIIANIVTLALSLYLLHLKLIYG